MDIEFWRLATSMQAVTSLLMVAFFVTLARSSGSRAVRLWAGAWSANLIGLAAVMSYWVLLPRVALTSLLAFSLYIFAKSACVLMLGLGIAALVDRHRAPRLYAALPALAVLAVVGGLLAMRSFYYASIIQNAVIAVGMGSCAIYLLGLRLPHANWLVASLGLRALLGLVELIGNLATWHDWLIVGPWHIRTLMASSSSLDAAAEWLIALGSLLVFYELTQRNLAHTNTQLEETQRSLRDLVNRDQLTGLMNRRALAEMLSAERTTRTSFVFFDIDHFKHINDSEGHDAGDACLKRFAAVLKASFRNHDAIVRYAGDEFIVVAPDLPPAALQQRIDTVRRELAVRGTSTPAIRFSHGVVDIAPGDDPDVALRAADRAMYANKAANRNLPASTPVTDIHSTGLSKPPPRG